LKLDNILGLEKLSTDEINTILKTTDSMREVLGREVKKVPTLRGKLVANLFYEPSTRTKSSFNLAAKRLSADTMSISAKSSSIVKGESLIDNGRTLCALGADAIVMRHSMPGAAKLLADNVEVPVLNAGDGIHEHPTQALLDIYTLQEELAEIKGKKIVIVGDILHSRVARSNIWGLLKLGAEVSLVAPETLLPANIEQLGVKVYNQLKPAIKDADAINLLRIQQERQEKGYFPSLKEYISFYGLRTADLAETKKDITIMHPGPMNRGVEISTEIIDEKGSIIERQVTNGVAVRMALLYLLIGGQQNNE